MNLLTTSLSAKGVQNEINKRALIIRQCRMWLRGNYSGTAGYSTRESCLASAAQAWNDLQKLKQIRADLKTLKKTLNC